ncbi:hypothetical protein ACIA8C_37310 [Nocardia sp. NPDC051321]|uniref:hypothetical protein n=1 Tax=Nocardia sp. NPDC051321 TaxID=3364323 RepID=UPI0037B95587
MKHIGGALAAAGAVLALALGGATTAHADPVDPGTLEAKGTFIYTHHGDHQRLEDPKNNRCYRIEGKGFAENKTNRVAELFRGDDCEGKVVNAMGPGERERDVEFRSVRFIK